MPWSWPSPKLWRAFDRLADHADHCHQFQDAWTIKSTSVENFILQCCREAGLPNVTQNPLFPGLGKPDGKADGWGPGGSQQLIIEVAVVAARIEDADEDGHAAKSREKCKLGEQRGIFFSQSPAHDFRPFVVEAQGRLGPCALVLLQELAEVAAQKQDRRLVDQTKQYYPEKWPRQLSCIMQSHIAGMKNLACIKAFETKVIDPIPTAAQEQCELPVQLPSSSIRSPSEGTRRPGLASPAHSVRSHTSNADPIIDTSPTAGVKQDATILKKSCNQ